MTKDRELQIRSLGHTLMESIASASYAEFLDSLRSSLRCRFVFFIKNRVNDSIRADANALQVLLTGQFARTLWPRMDCKGFDLREDAANDREVEYFQFVACRTGKRDGIFSHGACLDGEDDLSRHPEILAVHGLGSVRRYYRKSLPTADHAASDR